MEEQYSADLQQADTLWEDRARITWLIPLLIALVTFAVFLPTFWNGFVDWDDETNFLGNPDYRGLGWKQVKWMLTTGRA